MAVIIGMAAILFLEYSRLRHIETEASAIRYQQQHINTVHRHLAVLASWGESVVVWEESDYQDYRERRLRTDSLLQLLQQYEENFVPAYKIDTLRSILASKEKHLHQTMQTFHRQDSMLLKQLPDITRQAESYRTVTRKKKGIAGLFGSKETVQVPNPEKSLHSMNEQLISMEEARQQAINAHMDSLRIRNRELNRRLYGLIRDLDAESQSVFQERELHIRASYSRLTKTITGLIVSAIILLVVSYWIIQRDIREKARTKRELEELIEKLRRSVKKNKELLAARRQILQTITHELRSPLAAICGNIELVATDTSPAAREQRVQIIRLSLQRMSSMLTDLLNFFRLDNGKEQVCSKPFRLRCITNTLGREFSPQMEKKNLAFKIDACDNEIVVGDKNMILRVGSNLLSNAVKFTERGDVTLKTSYSDGVFTLEVSDTGCGITEQQRKQIFRPFERLANAATQDGFGLGLPIVQELVTLMDGTIYVESMIRNGSRFTVSIPLRRAEDGVIEADNILNNFKNLQDASVLILDNDPVQLAMTRDMLARYEIGCDTCRNVGELLNMMRERKYDLLITDMKMPDMNGYEVLELLRSSDIGNSRSIPIVVVTALDESAEKELLSEGFCGCLFKPFSANELLETLSRYIGHEPRRKEIELSPLLAYGDNAETLDRLITETEKEMAELRKAHEKRDMAELDNMIHHLRSSWMLINADHSLRELYSLIHQLHYDDADLNGKVQAVLNTGEHIIRLARKTREELWEK